MTGRTYKRQGKAGVSWSVLIEAGRDENGNRIRTSEHGYATKREADARRIEMLREISETLPDGRADITLHSLLKKWLDQHAREKCAPKTFERYKQLAAYLSGDLVDTPVSRLTTLALEAEYLRLHKSGGKDGAPLSAKTVRHIAGVVHAALRRGIRWGLVKTNVAEHCELPRVERQEAAAIDGDQTEQLLAAVEGHWMHPIMLLAVATGCRRGEILALTWSDVDFNRGAIMVSKSLEQTKAGLRVKSTKNTKARVLPLPPSTVDALRAHKAAQAAIREDIGPGYRTDLDLVFAGPDGDYLKPDSVTATACTLARKAGLEGVGMHSLRHSHGSQLLSFGVPLPVVSRRLGHADPSITARVYSHAFASDEVAAAEKWDAGMKGSKKRQAKRKATNGNKSAASR